MPDCGDPRLILFFFRRRPVGTGALTVSGAGLGADFSSSRPPALQGGRRPHSGARSQKKPRAPKRSLQETPPQEGPQGPFRHWGQGRPPRQGPMGRTCTVRGLNPPFPFHPSARGVRTVRARTGPGTHVAPPRNRGSSRRRSSRASLRGCSATELAPRRRTRRGHTRGAWLVRALTSSRPL